MNSLTSKIFLPGAFCAFWIGNCVIAASAADWTIVDLGSIGGAYSDGKSINNRGQAVGSAYTFDNASYHAFLFDQGRMIDLDTLGGSNSVAMGISDNGFIAGSSYLV